MCTTFGVKITEHNIIEVAFRTSTDIHFTNSLASLLPDNTEVIPLDNTAQGIKTIGDIKKDIAIQKTKNLLRNL